VHENNRRSQAAFEYVNGGHTENADVNTTRNSVKRFGADDLNDPPLPDVKAVLESNFLHPPSLEGRSLSAGRDILRKGMSSICNNHPLNLNVISLMAIKQLTI
jgi:hypothetical protein